MSDKTFSRRSPQVEYTVRPGYYESDDVAHVLARVRFMLEFSDAADEKLRLDTASGTALLDLYMDRLGESLAPYALDLALSLIALEDSLEKPAGDVGLNAR